MSCTYECRAAFREEQAKTAMSGVFTTIAILCSIGLAYGTGYGCGYRENFHDTERLKNALELQRRNEEGGKVLPQKGRGNEGGPETDQGQ